MDGIRKKQLLEILDYWKTVEFLGQIDIPTESNENKKLINKIADGEEFSEKKIEIFTDLYSDINMQKKLEKDAERFTDLPALGNEVYFCIGSVNRNSVVDYLKKYIENSDELPELAYPKKSAVAWFSFKTNVNGGYVKGSFRLSPLLWAMRVWGEKRSENGNFFFSTDKYDELMEQFDESCEEKNVSEFLEEIYYKIYYEYVKVPFPDAETSPLGFYEYNRYISESEKEKDDMPTDYSDLGRSYIINDLILAKELIRDDKFGDGSEYERKVADYILSAYEKSKGMGNMVRTVISPDEPREKMFDFFNTVLNVRNAPLGKWPAKFMPALMQQVAVNIAIDNEGHTPVFSVNGPPGTGKTTLLKEIVANNIVERAILIAKEAEADPDSAFERKFFRCGPLANKNNAYLEYAPAYYKLKNDKINGYSMLVTSCNNAAVENITVDLPKSSDLLKGLRPSDDDREDIKKGLDEVYALFDVEQSEDTETLSAYDFNEKAVVSYKENDIFFTRYANKLLNTKDCWGLISAPLGKRENIRKYCKCVLKPFINDYKTKKSREEHKEKYVQQRDLFLKQLDTVRKLEEELAGICENGKTDTKYTEGENKLVPVDSAFMDRYFSADTAESTKAQITNPWFTAKYNREREKLFLYACRLHKEFAAASSAVCQNIKNILLAWNMSDETDEKMTAEDKAEAFPVLLQTIFLITPVISTTFASVNVFLRDVKKCGTIGTLIVDEAGQAPPQMAIGALLRCRKAIIVGDPKQIEPVVTAESDMFKQLISSELLRSYKDKKLSVQGFADYINPYGTYLGKDEEREWVGCPLIVHRRCIDPMYSVSNMLSYDGTMKQQTAPPKADLASTFILDRSYWINVKGNEEGNKNHFVKAQGEIVLKLLEKKFENDRSDIPKLFIITPFTSVKSGMTAMIKNSEWFRTEPRAPIWLDDNNIGTVHTFQGQGTDEVIFLLGCDRTSVGAANWVNKNIVNVAATRAKFRFYVIGDKDVWECKPVKLAREVISEELSEAELMRILEPQRENEQNICPRCGRELVKRSGKFGDFMGCKGYPNCKFTRKIETVADGTELR